MSEPNEFVKKRPSWEKTARTGQAKKKYNEERIRLVHTPQVPEEPTGGEGRRFILRLVEPRQEKGESLSQRKSGPSNKLKSKRPGGECHREVKKGVGKITERRTDRRAWKHLGKMPSFLGLTRES